MSEESIVERASRKCREAADTVERLHPGEKLQLLRAFGTLNGAATDLDSLAFTSEQPAGPIPRLALVGSR